MAVKQVRQRVGVTAPTLHSWSVFILPYIEQDNLFRIYSLGANWYDPVNQPVRYGNLVFTVRDCETTTADEPAQDAVAYVEVQSQAPNPSGNSPSLKQVFKGWMFADSPSVNPMQHPVYDAWLIACKA